MTAYDFHFVLGVYTIPECILYDSIRRTFEISIN